MGLSGGLWLRTGAFSPNKEPTSMNADGRRPRSFAAEVRGVFRQRHTQRQAHAGGGLAVGGRDLVEIAVVVIGVVDIDAGGDVLVEQVRLEEADRAAAGIVRPVCRD